MKTLTEKNSPLAALLCQGSSKDTHYLTNENNLMESATAGNIVSFKNYDPTCTFPSCWEVLNCTQFKIHMAEPIKFFENGIIQTPRESIEFYQFRKWLKKSG